MKKLGFRVILLATSLIFLILLAACQSEQFSCGEYQFDTVNETTTFCVEVLSQINESQQFVAYHDGVVLACPLTNETNSRRCGGMGVQYILYHDDWRDIDSYIGSAIVIRTLGTSWFDIRPRYVTVLDWWPLEE